LTASLNRNDGIFWFHEKRVFMVKVQIYFYSIFIFNLSTTNYKKQTSLHYVLRLNGQHLNCTNINTNPNEKYNHGETEFGLK